MKCPATQAEQPQNGRDKHGQQAKKFAQRSVNEHNTTVNYKSIITTIGLGAAFAAAGVLSSCNKDSDSTVYQDPVNLAVTEFSLIADSKNPGLDSVYFSIDLEHGVIFNADSLRKGTRINKVVPKITFSGEVSEAVFVMSGGTTREGEVDFRENPTDSIDFTGDVTLRVKAANGTIGTSYRVKVNVHTMDTDTLMWNDINYMGISTRLPDPKAMKTVRCGDKVVSLVSEKDGTYTRSVPTSLTDFTWEVTRVSLPFTPDVHTLSASGETLWVLDSEGRLWKGDAYMSSWSDTGEMWTAMIGTYNDTAVGLTARNGIEYFAQYPLSGLNVKEVPDDFPVEGFSNFVTLSNKWTSSPVAFFTGGVMADSGRSLSNATWAFDGAEWIRLSSGGIPALEGASIIPYYNFRPSAQGNSMIEYPVWMLIGGRLADGDFNRTVYISYDNGVNWARGATSLQLPKEIPSMIYCDNVVAEIEKSYDIAAGWQSVSRRPQRVSYKVDGTVITWGCPYIFLFGGYEADGRLNTNVWRGVLNRLTFAPII